MSAPRFLICSTFPGIGLLDMAFEQEWPDACIVRGPDVLWGGDVRRFHIPRGCFEGIIGGPPCQPFSRLRHMVEANGYQPRHENLIGEFERLVGEGEPWWFLMEEVPAAPLPVVDGYRVQSIVVNNRQVPAEPGGCIGPEQNRVRRFSLGTQAGFEGEPFQVEPALLANPVFEYAVAAAGGGRDVPVAIGGSGLPKRSAGSAMRNRGYQSGDGLKKALRLQGLPEDYLDEAPFTLAGKYRVVGNGVPIPLGRAVARAVRRALGLPLVSEVPA